MVCHPSTGTHTAIEQAPRSAAASTTFASPSPQRTPSFIAHPLALRAGAPASNVRLACSFSLPLFVEIAFSVSTSNGHTVCLAVWRQTKGLLCLMGKELQQNCVFMHFVHLFVLFCRCSQLQPRARQPPVGQLQLPQLPSRAS